MRCTAHWRAPHADTALDQQCHRHVRSATTCPRIAKPRTHKPPPPAAAPASTAAAGGRRADAAAPLVERSVGPFSHARPRRQSRRAQSRSANRDDTPLARRRLGDRRGQRHGSVDAVGSIHHTRSDAPTRAPPSRAIIRASSPTRDTTAAPSGRDTTTNSGAISTTVVGRSNPSRSSAVRRSTTTSVATAVLRLAHQVDPRRWPPRRADQDDRVGAIPDDRAHAPSARRPRRRPGGRRSTPSSSSMHSIAAETHSASSVIGPRTVAGPDLDDDAGHGGSVQATWMS